MSSSIPLRTSRPIEALIHSRALTHNLGVVRRAAPRSRVWSVVKANAYGHGLRHVFPALSSTDGFALLDLPEALQLREWGWSGPVLLLEGFFTPDDLPLIVQHQFSPVVHSLEQVAMLERFASVRNIEIFLKINTGMNRLGIKPDQVRAVYARLRELPLVKNVHLMTHFACADTGQEVERQQASFQQVTQSLAGERSLCNSAGLLRYPQAQADWVRPGIMLYGGSPFTDSPARVWDLQAAMTLCSRLIAIQSVKAGEGVGYGHIFRAPCDMRIGVVACGYADGYPRHAPSTTPVSIHGVRSHLVGRVSMDMIMINLDPVPQAQVGDLVELWGAHIPIDEVAQHAGTIGYELMCALAPRVPVKVM